MSREEAIGILSDMRAEYNLFGDEEEATRYHVLSWAIQTMKRKTGRWIRDDEYDDLWRCSECGYEFAIEGADIPSYFYCPDCGAKMDEVEKCE